MILIIGAIRGLYEYNKKHFCVNYKSWLWVITMKQEIAMKQEIGANSSPSSRAQSCDLDQNELTSHCIMGGFSAVLNLVCSASRAEFKEPG